MKNAHHSAGFGTRYSLGEAQVSKPDKTYAGGSGRLNVVQAATLRLGYTLLDQFYL
ncbi:Unknown protein sequence [Pseudomonas coronafaciens pv. oryzae]|nr:Unknown protein sequence [Pseudomonas coronafaciens pv. oryzae]